MQGFFSMKISMEYRTLSKAGPGKMEEQIRRSMENGRRIDANGCPPRGFWVVALAWWRLAVKDSSSVKRNLAMLFGVTLAVMLCIGSVGGAVALIIGSVHAWSVAGTGVSVASVLTAVGLQRRRKRRKP
jgi:hypothetical protein